MKERYLNKTPFLTFVYLSKCNINLPCILRNSNKRILWTGLMYTIHTVYTVYLCIHGLPQTSVNWAFSEAHQSLRRPGKLSDYRKIGFFSTFWGGHWIFLPWIVWPLVARLLSALRKNKCKWGNFTISDMFELRPCIMFSAIFVHLSLVYLRLSFLFLGPVYRVLSPDICQDWNLKQSTAPCVF